MCVKFIAAALLVTSACAHAEVTADDAAALYATGDGISTYAALASGRGVEANPIMPTGLVGIVAVTALKASVPYVLKAAGVSAETRKEVDVVISAVGAFATCNNILVALGAATGHVYLPAAGGLVCSYFAARDTASRPIDDTTTAEIQP